MDRRTVRDLSWVVGRDDLGRAVLEWRTLPELEARTRPVLRDNETLTNLGAHELALQEDSARHRTEGFNPYDRGVPRHQRRWHHKR